MNYEAQIENVGPDKYNVFMYGESVLQGVREPGLGVCRLLKEKGLHGLVSITDHKTGQLRFTCNIDKCADLTVTTDNYGNTIFRKYNGKS